MEHSLFLTQLIKQLLGVRSQSCTAGVDQMIRLLDDHIAQGNVCSGVSEELVNKSKHDSRCGILTVSTRVARIFFTFT